MINLLLYLLLCYLLGYSISRNLIKENSFINSLALSILLGISTHVLLAHLLALKFGSFTSCSIFILILMGIYLSTHLVILKFRDKDEFFKFEKFKTFDYLSLFSACAFGLLFALRELTFGDPDRGHLAISSSIFHNSMYPPAFPTGIDYSMSYYHYAVDLILVIFRQISGLPVWDITAFQIGLGAFLTFVSAFTLINSLVDKKKISYFLVFIFIFYTSINSLQFFIQEIGNLGNYDFFEFCRKWLLVSWTSVSHVTSQLRVLGQNFGMPLFFSILYILFNLFKETGKQKIQNYIGLLVLSFALYFCYPTYWFPLFLSSAGLIAWIFLLGGIKDKKFFFRYIAVLVLLYLGKYLSFTSSHTSVGGINAMLFSPDLYWVHWGKAYIRYFYDLSYLQSLKPVMDHMTYSKHLLIPLFSNISLREFGFCFIIASGLFIKESVSSFRSKTFKVETILYFISLSSFLVPFLFDFILRPVETSRFLFITKAFALLYSLIVLTRYIKLKKSFVKVIVISLVFVSLLPGFISVLPDTRFAILGNKLLTAEEKNIVSELKKIHKDGEIILDDGSFESAYDIANIAGFYGVGGQFFKIDKVTRITALNTLDPKLLNELSVDYVLLNKGKHSLAIENIELEYLTKVPIESSTYILLKFNKGYVLPESYLQSYYWVLGYQIAEMNRLQYLTNGEGQKIVSPSREELRKLLPQMKKSLFSNNPILAIWLREYAEPLQRP